MKQLNLWTAALLLVSLALPMNLSAQKASKVSQSIKVDDAVTVELNTNYCNIELDTWNKDVVEIEAYIDGEKLSQEALQEALERWHVDVDATSQEVVISTSGSSNYDWDFGYRFEGDDAVIAAIDELKFTLADIPELTDIPDLPKLPKLPKVPEMELPPLPEGINQIRFDYEAYKKDGEKYMKEWNKEFEQKFGEKYEKEMEAWAEKFEKEWEEKYGEEWEERFEKQMEQWGERFGEQMEQWGERVEKQMEQREKMQAERAKIQEERAKQREEIHAQREEANAMRQEQRAQVTGLRKARVESMINSNVKRVIKIKVPKKAKLKLNVKHGELKLASNVSNLKADLVYTKLTANNINGSDTSINVSYAPVVVNNWDLGRLNLNYVENAQLVNVDHLVLSSNSSNVYIDKVNSNAIVDGSFGVLKILNVAPDFSGMNLVLENSDMVLVLPQTDFNLQFKGNQTFLKHPKNTKRELIKQYNLGDLSNSKTILVNAKFSDVKFQ